MLCPSCEGEMFGDRCRCGFVRPRNEPAKRTSTSRYYAPTRYRLCSWVYPNGSKCELQAQFDMGRDCLDEDLLCAAHFDYKSDSRNANDFNFIQKKSKEREDRAIYYKSLTKRI